MITLHRFLAVEEAMPPIYSCYVCLVIEVSRIVVPAKYTTRLLVQIVVIKTQRINRQVLLQANVPEQLRKMLDARTEPLIQAAVAIITIKTKL
jgi:endonuclease III-like uncharacterized protein